MKISKFKAFLATGFLFLLLVSVIALVFSAGINQDSITKFFSNEILVENRKAPSDLSLEKVVVSIVIDGDTVKLEDGRTIRYLNVDTPETKKASTPVMCFGPEASEFNRRMVENKTIWIKGDKQDQDRYGRYLRFIFLSEEAAGNIDNSLNALIVKEGYGRTSIYKPNNTFEKKFYDYQKQAQEKKSGIWGACPKPFEK